MNTIFPCNMLGVKKSMRSDSVKWIQMLKLRFLFSERQHSGSQVYSDGTLARSGTRHCQEMRLSQVLRRFLE